MAAQVQGMEMVCYICGSAAGCTEEFSCCELCKKIAHRSCAEKARPMLKLQTHWLCEVCDTTGKALDAKPLYILLLGRKIPAAAMATGGGRCASSSMERGEGSGMAALPKDIQPIDVDEEDNAKGLDAPLVQAGDNAPKDRKTPKNFVDLTGAERVPHVARTPKRKLRGSKIRKPIGPLKTNGFVSRKVTREATGSFQHYYTAVWLTWRKVPEDARQKAWLHFKKYGRFYWEREMEDRVKECFMRCLRTRFRDLLLQERSRALERANSQDLNDAKAYYPWWIREELWVQLCDLWLQKGWQERSRKCSENRRKVKSKPKNAASAAAVAAVLDPAPAAVAAVLDPAPPAAVAAVPDPAAAAASASAAAAANT